MKQTTVEDAAGVSRRQFLGAAGATVAVAAAGAPDTVLSAQASQAPAPSPTQEVAFVNGRIHTMDARNTVASSVTVRNGRVVQVNGNPPSGVRRVDLRGRTMVPGLIEGHV